MEEKRIRVAQVIGKCSEGGVESAIMNFYRNIDHEKVIFDFFVENESLIINKKEIESYGGHVYIVPKYSHIFSFQKCLFKHFKENNYDVVHANMNAQSFLALAPAKKAKVKVRIAHSHTTSNKQEHLRHLIKQTLRIFSKTNATNYFACSDKAGLWMFGKKAYEKGEITFIKNSIDTNKFSFNASARNEIRSKYNVDDSTFLIGHVGRFVQVKNHGFIIDILCELNKQNHNFKLCLVGSGPYRDGIKEKVNNLGLNDKVIFVDPVPDTSKFYSSFDCFILPSLYEGLPVVGIEAQVNGLRCLFSDRVTHEAKISDYSEFLSIDNCDLWCDKIKSFNVGDRTKNVESETFDIKATAALLLKTYEKLIDENK